ncbi:MAG TPA: polysaccharide deacetylase family protein [Candidatus Acidoferrales bacterium]|nr:polysaccharide deacetylase family protein [Candidatus Acidoferrales bacterium]
MREYPPMNPWLIGAPAAVAAASGALSYFSLHPRSEFFGPNIHATNSAKKLAVTFDDGPNPSITPQLLDLLDRYNVHATFFVIGRFVRTSPDLLLETIARGHSVGNHTETHPRLVWCRPSVIREELESGSGAVLEVLGHPPRWFRPPYGLRNPWVIPAATRLGLRTVTWSLICWDWKAPSAEWLIPRMQPIASRALARSNGRGDFRPGATGDILCLHDGDHRFQNGDRRPTLAALEHWLPRWRDLGLDFVTIDEAVGEPAL